MYNIEPPISLSPAADNAMPQDACLVQGTVIAGQFEVLSKLGSGGMSSVYRCLDLFVERIVAVKVLYAGQTTNPKALNRFRREARAIAKLDHPNIVRLHAFNFDLACPYIVMESVDGITLADLIETNGPLEINQVMKLAEQLCSALQYAHDNGVIHRDLKPSNIIIERFDSHQLQAKILDFGIAKMIDDTTPGATTTGELFGTPAYMSPEQALGKVVDRRSDQYSLGCVLFECLTGSPPFVGSGQLSVLMQHVQSEVPSLEDWTFSTREYSPQIQPVLDKMLAKFPADRYDSLREVCENMFSEHSEAQQAVVVFANLMEKAETSLRSTHNNVPAMKDPNSPFGFLLGLAVGAAIFLVILAIAAAIYLAFAVQSVPETIKPIAGITQKEQLLGGIDITKALSSVSHQIKQNRQRKELTVEDKAVSNRELIALRGAHSIERLNLSFCENINENGLQYAYHLPLIDLNLKNTSVTSRGCKEIALHFPNLHDLSLQQTPVKDEGIAHLAKLKYLTALDIKFTDVVHASGYINQMPMLASLNCDSSSIDLTELNSPTLHYLNASSTDVNEKLITAILRCKQLDNLSLNKTNITDDQLRRLAVLKNLRVLNIQDCVNITASGIKRFKHANPVCKVTNIEVGEVQKEIFIQACSN